MAGVEIRNFTRFSCGESRSAFSKVADEVLPDWDISLVFIGEKKARDLNIRLRDKSYTPNVLSYALGAKSGEIIICPSEARKQAPDFQLSTSSFLLLLFIHGVLHLKGWAHSVRMEKCEQTLLAEYGAENSNRHRHRHVPDKSGRRRGIHPAVGGAS